MIKVLLLNEDLPILTPLTSTKVEIQFVNAKDVALDLALSDPLLKTISPLNFPVEK